MEPVITKNSLLSMQVCVPKEWTDAIVKEFADRENPSGLPNGWAIRREGDKALVGDPERRVCKSHAENVHIMLDC